VALAHPDIARESLRALAGRNAKTCEIANSVAFRHETFFAGILCAAKRGSATPAICPGCTLLVRTMFSEGAPDADQMPSATPEELETLLSTALGGGARWTVNKSECLPCLINEVWSMVSFPVLTP
jgi:hypothetical protein